MTAIGEKLPEATLTLATADGPSPSTVSEMFDGKTVVLFAVPGAFTPTCHLNHMPGFVTHANAMKAKGVDTVACLAVNDPFVMKAWGDATGALGTVHLIADGSAAFTQAIDMGLDLTEHGLGMRSKRFAMIVKDREVTALMTEDNPGKAEVSTAEAVLAAL